MHAELVQLVECSNYLLLNIGCCLLLQIGCTLPNAYCPAAAKFFRVWSTATAPATPGQLVGGDIANVYCFRDAVSPVTGCPVTGSGATGVFSIPVRSSNVAGDSSASILGCINAATAGTGDLGTNACPTDLPVANPAGSEGYTFFVASGIAVSSGNPTVTAGNVIECRLKASRSCGNLASMRAYNAAVPEGCIALAASCPATGFSSASPRGFTFGLYGSTSATDGTARLEACVTSPAPASASTQTSCINILPAGTWTVPMSNQPISAALSTDGIVTGLQGCLRALNTSCPVVGTTTYLPLISSSLQIQACRAVGSACPAGYVHLCNADVLADGRCNGAQDTPATFTPVTSALGCAAITTPAQCRALQNANKYPTTGGTAFKFVVNVGSTSTLIGCATMGTSITCKAASNPIRAYPAGTNQCCQAMIAVVRWRTAMPPAIATVSNMHQLTSACS
jgi:hypothetical protein